MYHRLMPIAAGGPECVGIVPSAPSELAWLATLLVSSRPYAAPALAELDQALLPGLGSRQAVLRERFAAAWDDGVDGVPELLFLAAATGTLLSEDPKPFLAAVARLGSREPVELRMLGEREAEADAIRGRIDRLRADAGLRESYIAILGDVWTLAATTWRMEGLKRVRNACREWERRLAGPAPVEQLLSPRHPLARTPDRGRILAEVPSFVVSPLFFCLSGGLLTDSGEYLHIGVPASDLHPIRRERDAAFVAGRFRVLAEPTRVRLYISILSAPASVSELAAGLRLPQSTVSDHLSILRRAGLLEARRSGARTVYATSLTRVERLFEEARATLAIWE
jgi:DNA-binding transcriptional ArsR family regulator